jgi:hypothetical protein
MLSLVATSTLHNGDPLHGSSSLAEVLVADYRVPAEKQVVLPGPLPSRTTECALLQAQQG